MDLLVDYDIPTESLHRDCQLGYKSKSVDLIPASGLGRTQLLISFVQFTGDFTVDQATAELARRGLSWAGVTELLHVGLTSPHIALEFLLVAFGSRYDDPDGLRHVPCLGRDGDLPASAVFWEAIPWISGNTLFLAINQ